ncbi:MAG: hypothetical protein ACUVQZ_03195 [Candidatus Caldatribacteriaceae bacterium]
MIKTLFLVYSWLILIMGILGAIPGIPLGTEPTWHAILKIILGLVGIVFSMREKQKS